MESLMTKKFNYFPSLIALAGILAVSGCSSQSPNASLALSGGLDGRVSPLGLSVEPGRSPLNRPAPSFKRPPVVLAQDATSAASTDGGSSASQANTLVETDDPASMECLKCHGPFAKLAARTEDFLTEWDEKVNPHIYVPHDKKTIVDCLDCHAAHPVPVTSGMKVTQAKLQYCYSCHHTESFESCTDCHNE